MKIALASDHAGYQLKEFIKKRLKDNSEVVVDFGTDSEHPCDYPDYGRAAAEAVARGHCDVGILICGTGIGMSIVANKVPGVFAALCSNGLQAELSRRHNNANVLVLGGWMIGQLLAEEIVHRWLTTEFEGGRHQRRLEKISAIGPVLGK